MSHPVPDSQERRFWIFALGQALLWVTVPSLIFANLPLDVIEGLAWGHGWPAGTYKHPPLQAWLLELAAIFGGRHDTAIYAVGAGSLLLTYWALWRFGKMILAPSAALMGVMAMAACFYFATSIPEFNPNIVQIPLYALCGWLFWRALEGDKIRDWLLFGLCAGLGMLGKYSFAFMLVGLGGFMVVDTLARSRLRRPGPYFALLVGILTFLPHALWLVDSGFLPMDYAHSRTEFASHAGWAIFYGVKFALTQLLVIAPVLIIVWLARSSPSARAAINMPLRTQRYLAVLAWSPLVLVTATSLMTGARLRDMWGTALWPFLGLWAASLWQSDWERNRFARYAFILAMAVMPLTVTAGALYSVPFGFRPWRTEFPGKELAAAAEAFWQKRHSDSPLRIVLGDAWFGGNIAWYGAARPQLMINGSETLSPWVTPTEVERQGALAVWDPDWGGEALPQWAERFGRVEAIETVPLLYGGKVIHARFALIAPVP